MYRPQNAQQMSFEDFNQPLGMHMSPDNRWIKRADSIPWAKLEPIYAKAFPKHTGNIAKTFRMAFAALDIQAKYDLSNRELVQMIMENPYFQYYLGLPGYEYKAPFEQSSLFYFKQRLTPEILAQVNEVICQEAKDNQDKHNGKPTHRAHQNRGTLVLDATAVPANIKYPQDPKLLNDALVHTAKTILQQCHRHHLKVPELALEEAHRDYLNYAKMKRPGKQRRVTQGHQVAYLKVALVWMGVHEAQLTLSKRQARDLTTAQTICAQQEFMFKTNTNRVDNRIVSFSQPHVRPIKRGKIKCPTEFGQKIDVSNSNGYLRIEHESNTGFNEADDLIPVCQRYHNREGGYPRRLLVDELYRTKANLAWCKEHHIRVSGNRLGTDKVHEFTTRQGYKDERDRTMIERDFAVAKANHGLARIRSKVTETVEATIGMAIASLNLDKMMRILFCPSLVLAFIRLKSRFLCRTFDRFLASKTRLEPSMLFNSH